MASVDVGQGAAATLYQQAQAGTFVMDLDAAKRCAQHFQTFAESLEPQVKAAHNLMEIQGFGSLDSAKDLRKGFSAKGIALVNTLLGMQEAAYQMAAAYLEAAQQVEAAQDMTTRALYAHNQEIKSDLLSP